MPPQFYPVRPRPVQGAGAARLPQSFLRNAFPISSDASGLSHSLAPRTFLTTRPRVSTRTIKGMVSAPGLLSSSRFLVAEYANSSAFNHADSAEKGFYGLVSRIWTAFWRGNKRIDYLLQKRQGLFHDIDVRCVVGTLTPVEEVISNRIDQAENWQDQIANYRGSFTPRFRLPLAERQAHPVLALSRCRTRPRNTEHPNSFALAAISWAEFRFLRLSGHQHKRQDV